MWSYLFCALCWFSVQNTSILGAYNVHTVYIRMVQQYKISFHLHEILSQFSAVAQHVKEKTCSINRLFPNYFISTSHCTDIVREYMWLSEEWWQADLPFMLCNYCSKPKFWRVLPKSNLIEACLCKRHLKDLTFPCIQYICFDFVLLHICFYFITYLKKK